jgi:hypothetical protein
MWGFFLALTPLIAKFRERWGLEMPLDAEAPKFVQPRVKEIFLILLLSFPHYS